MKYKEKSRVGDAIYNSTSWRKLRKAYHDSQHGICERCEEPGDVVHHIIHITEQNINNPEITFGFDNLELLCHNCHNKEHKQKHSPIRDGFGFDEEGNLLEIK